jgi:hypothetical protein
MMFPKCTSFCWIALFSPGKRSRQVRNRSKLNCRGRSLLPSCLSILSSVLTRVREEKAFVAFMRVDSLICTREEYQVKALIEWFHFSDV